MARHKKRQTGPRFWQKRKDRGKGYQFDFGMKEETRKEVVALVTLIFGVLLLLSIFGLAGVAGRWILHILKLGFGDLAYLLPFVFLSVIVSAVSPKLYEIRLSTVVGYLLLFTSFDGLLQMILASSSSNSAKVAVAGGFLGYASSAGLTSIVGSIAAFLVLFVIFLLSLAMSLNTSLIAIWRQMNYEGDETPRRITVNEGGTKTSILSRVSRGLGGLSLRRSAQPASRAPVIEVRPMPTAIKSTQDGAWTPPPLDLLETYEGKANPGNIQKNVEVIEKTLKEFNIDVTMQDVNVGPTVTQYTFKPAEGVKLANITARSNDLALALAAKSLRMEAPIPGQAAVGVEIPNKQTATVSLREMLESTDYHAGRGKLSIALGRDVAGSPVVIDLERLPHLLIAGSTGSGKSVAINSIIVTYIMNNSPTDLRLLLVDPKRVELTGYNGIPHLMTPVITEADKTVSALKWAVAEMEDRYRIFADAGHRNIASYNEKPGQNGRLPHIVVIIDELADLMAVAANEVEASIVRLAQMARATGIHLIVATQRPSVDVITGLIKANIPARIAFTVASQVDSRTILDVGGAEKLLGLGDMLYLGVEVSKPRRIQGCYVSDKEINAITAFLKKDQFVQYDESITTFKPTGDSQMVGGEENLSEDALYQQAMTVVIQAGKASASLLQRRLRIGYSRAARLLDLLEHEGVIGPADGAKPRDVLVSTSELREVDDRF